MLKFLRGLLIAIGIVLIVATLALLVYDIIQINQIVAVANANKSNAAGFNPNPRWLIILGVGGALLGGFVLGFGLGLPKRTFKQRLQEQTEQEARGAALEAPAA